MNNYELRHWNFNPTHDLMSYPQVLSELEIVEKEETPLPPETGFFTSPPEAKTGRRFIVITPNMSGWIHEMPFKRI